MKLLFVCTGNAARSVMAASMAKARIGDVEVRSAGTLSIEGRPMSERTRVALEHHGLDDRDHRSRQLGEDDLTWADVVAVFEPSHLLYIRRHHPTAANKTVALPRLVSLLVAQAEGRTVNEVMEAIDIAAIEATPDDEVIDPAGGDQPAFDEAATTIGGLIDSLATEIARRQPERPGPEESQ